MASLIGGAERGAGLWFTLKRLVSISTLTIFMVILLGNALIITLQTHNPQAGLQDIGHRVFGSTQTLDSESQKIIQQGGVIFTGDTLPRKIWNFFLAYSGLAVALLSIYFWIQIFAWISEHTFIGRTHPIKNFIFGCVIFYLLEVLYILVLTDPPNRPAVLLLPLNALWHFAQSLPYLVTPAANAIHNVENSELLNRTLSKLN